MEIEPGELRVELLDSNIICINFSQELGSLKENKASKWGECYSNC
jgi:hypothetical protein